jgi:hypothetical protein
VSLLHKAQVLVEFWKVSGLGGGPRTCDECAVSVHGTDLAALPQAITNNRETQTDRQTWYKVTAAQVRMGAHPGLLSGPVEAGNVRGGNGFGRGASCEL